MCVAYPGQVLQIAADMAVVETEGRTQRATYFLVPELTVGDWVIVSTGTVIQILAPEEAAEIRTLLDLAARDEAAAPAAIGP